MSKSAAARHDARPSPAQPITATPPARRRSAARQPRILLYSHDSCGLGNVRRSLVLAELLGSRYPAGAILLITGSPMIHAYPLPPRMDYVKLPSVDRVSAETYEPRFLPDCAREIRRTRAEIIERTASGFEPDLVIVDKRAGGIDGELVPALRTLRAMPRRPQVILGIRDILDAPEVTRRVLRENGSFDLIRAFYDEVWIYGSRAVFDAVREYDFPPAVAMRTRYCGYLRRRAVARAPHDGPARVLVTTGGGSDGMPLLDAFLSAMADTSGDELRATVVLGPQLDGAEARRFHDRASALAHVECIDFDPDLTRRYEVADVVVSMAGYNTVCELLTAGVRAVLVPRAQPVQEQLIRARRLSARGAAWMVDPSELTPDRLMAAIRTALRSEPPATAPIDMEGLSRIRARVERMLERRDA